MKKIGIFIFLTFLLSTPVLRAQLLPPDQPEQDACNALVICGNGFFTPFSYQGIGQVFDLPNTPCGIPGGTPPDAREDNSVWLKLVVNTSGTIVFTITPVAIQDDYDFAVLNITNVSCSNIGSANVVRCNFNNNQPVFNGGVVGLNMTSTATGVPSGTTGSSYCRYIDAVAGEVYLIMVNNFGVGGGPSSGFNINFNGSTATFNDNTPPHFLSNVQSCNTKNEVVIKLTEEIKCSSIAPNGSDFSLAPGGNIISASGINCNASNQGYTDRVRIVFSPALAPGLYTLRAQTGSDGNTLLDLCDNPLTIPDSLKFRVYKLDSTIYRNICPAQLPYIWNGIVVTAGGPAAAIFHTPNVVGCDSVVTLNLTVTNVIHATVNKSVCPFQMPYTWNGIVVTVPGNAAAVYTMVNSVGCDSVTTLNLTVQQPVNQAFTLSGCGEVIINGTSYTASQIVKDTIISTIGCDSLYRTINVIVHPVNPVTHVVDTAGCGLVVFRGQTYTQSITLRDTLLNQFGCDSIYNITHIIVYPDVPELRTDYVADCDTVVFEGKLYFQDTELVDTFYNHLGCDSLVRTTRIHVEHFELTVTADPPEPVKGDWVLFSTTANVPGYSITAWLPQSVFNNQVAQENRIKIAKSDTIRVVGISELGCIDTAILFIKADSLIPVFVMPNAFSPNGDGLNDVFEPRFVNKSGYLVKLFQVYNRWGQLVYKAAGTKKAAWNGYYYNKDEIAEVGTYFYRVSVEFVDGTKETVQGDVIIVR